MGKLLKKIFYFINYNPVGVIIILIAAVLHLSVIIPSGSYYCFNSLCGDYYWGVQEHDGIWHIAVAETAFTSFYQSRLNPAFGGGDLSGYNILLDYIIFLFSTLGIPAGITYFKILPIFWFIFFSYSIIKFAHSHSKSKLFINLFLILTYFGTSWSFIFTLIKDNTLNDAQASTIMQPILTLTNLQLAFSYIVLLWVIMIVKNQIKKLESILLPLLVFFGWGFKFYTGMLLSIFIGVVYIYRFFRNRDKHNVLILFLTFLTTVGSILLIYQPNLYKESGSPFILQPLALLWPLIESPSSTYYSEYWANAKYVLLSSNSFSPRLLAFSISISILYVLINFGARILGFFQMIFKRNDEVDLGMQVMVIVGISMTLFFIQRGVWWNVVQFMYLVMFVLNHYTIKYILQIKNTLLLRVVIVLLIISAIPYSYYALKPYLTSGKIYISKNELNALKYLKNQKMGIVHAPLYNVKKKLLMGYKPVHDIRTSNDTSYISAYTSKPTLLQISGSLLLNIDYSAREKRIKNGDCSLINEFDYAYSSIEDTDKLIKECVEKNSRFRKIYSENGFIIYSKQT